jgi:hypothetical protein
MVMEMTGNSPGIPASDTTTLIMENKYTNAK